MNSGAEAADTACKTARKWGIVKKGIPAEQYLVLRVTESYHGLTSVVWNLQDKSRKREGLGIISYFGFTFWFSRGVGVSVLLTDWVCRIWT